MPTILNLNWKYKYEFVIFYILNIFSSCLLAGLEAVPPSNSGRVCWRNLGWECRFFFKEMEVS